MLGLHPGSVEFHQRYSQTFTQYYNALGFESDLVSSALTRVQGAYVMRGLAALAALGWPPDEDAELPAILDKIFLGSQNLLKGPLVAAETSETAPLPVTRGDGLNYIAWLISAARSSHDALRAQQGFVGTIPNALLYLMLQHALDLGYVDSGLQLRRDALGWGRVHLSRGAARAAVRRDRRPGAR
ncbi:MAG: hypothetical protein WDN44_07480 [Sphingomonas sp.]